VSDERVEAELRAWLVDHTESGVPDSLRRFLAELPSIQPDVDRVRRTGTARTFDRPRRGVLRLLVAAAAVVALAAGLGYGLSQRPGPPASNIPSSPPSRGSALPSGGPSTAVVDAALVDAERGWALTDVDLVWTDDGGASWTSIKPADVDARTIRAVHFIDERYGWIVWLSPDSSLATPTVERTTDGGRSWSVSHVPDAYPDGVGTVTIEAVDGGTVWIQVETVHSSASSIGGLYLSRDGGVSWVPGITMPGGWPVRFRSASDGWTLARPLRDELDATNDGGLTWHPVRIDLPPGHQQDAMSFDLPTFTGDASPSEAGVLPVTLFGPPDQGGDRTSTLAFYTTGDGGTSWRFAAAVGRTNRLGWGETFVSAIVDQSTWLVASIPDPSSLSKTADGGRTWTEVASTPLAAAVDQLRFVNTTTAWALAGAQLSATTDGGQTWAVLDPVARATVAPSPSGSLVAGPFRWNLVTSEGDLATYSVVGVIRRGDGTYLAMGFGQEVRVLRSQDGRTWTIEPGDPGLLAAATDHLTLVAGLAERSDVLVAVGSSALFDISSGDARAWTSSDGVRWQVAEPSKDLTDAAMEAVVAGPDGFVAVGSDGFPGGNTQLPGARGAAAWTSPDGKSWTRAPAQASFANAIMTGARRTPTGYVAWGQTLPFAHPGPPPPPIWTSADGIRWVRSGRGIADAGGPGTPISSVLSIGDRLVAVGTRQLPDALGAGNAPGAWTSVDGGRTWSTAVVEDGPATQPRSGGISDLAVDKPGLIAVGSIQPPSGQEGPGSAAVWRSSDGGSTWTRLPDDPTFGRAAMSRIVATSTGFIVFGSVDDPNAAANVALIWMAEPNP
jgi:photosystem II stability/assembly factor-like uncharacterized protein